MAFRIHVEHVRRPHDIERAARRHAAIAELQKRSRVRRRRLELREPHGRGSGRPSVADLHLQAALEHRRDLRDERMHVNFLDSDDDSSRVRDAYGDRTHRRLAEVKARYDPDNAFHHNANVRPRAHIP
jgi:hypothetical protein